MKKPHRSSGPVQSNTVNLFVWGSIMTERKSFLASDAEFRHSRPTTLNQNAAQPISEQGDTLGKASHQSRPELLTRRFRRGLDTNPALGAILVTLAI